MSKSVCDAAAAAAGDSGMDGASIAVVVVVVKLCRGVVARISCNLVGEMKLCRRESHFEVQTPH